MLNQSHLAFDALADLSSLGDDPRRSALVGRTLLQASAMLPLMPREAAMKALEGEAELLAHTDSTAAERALQSLQDARRLLSRALADVRMSDQVSCAIVCAADVLAKGSRREFD